MIKRAVRVLLRRMGYPPAMPAVVESRLDIPDKEFYAPLFSPWLGYGAFRDHYAIAKPFTLVSPDRCYVLASIAQQALVLPGAWMECGVYKGGTAMMLTKILRDSGSIRTLHLFDTFAGMPETDAKVDRHKRGEFKDTGLEEVQARIGAITRAGKGGLVRFHPGLIPQTFEECGIDRVALAHVDVDLFRSVLDCCEFVYPRLVDGGFFVFDDYGFPSCPGARKAVDEFFKDKKESPIVLPTGQALVVRMRDRSGYADTAIEG